MEKEDLHIPAEIQNYEKKIYDQRQIIEISKALNSQLDLDDLIDSILNLCLAHVHTFHAGVMLLDNTNGDELVLHHEFKGFDITDPAKFKLQVDSPLVEYIRKNPGYYEWNRLADNPEFIHEVRLLKELDPKLLVPLTAKGNLSGMIILGEKASGEEYPSSEMFFIQDLASLAGIATNNARLYELATTDMMTKLKLHHFFQSLLKDEMKKAHRDNAPLSFFLTDIDHFKKFNDTYGHQVGDVVLQSVAGILHDNVRRTDLAARYGGEEFCVVLPNTHLDEAIKIAEAIRSRVEENEVEIDGQTLKVTLSAGVAQYDPQSDKSNKDLIERADQALYSAKHAGRNQVKSWKKK